MSAAAENNEMKSKMEMVGVGGTTAKQDDGDGGGYSNDSAHHDEHGLTPYPDPGRHVVSDGTFITGTGTDTVDKVSKRFLPIPCKSSSLFFDENEDEALTPQDNSLIPRVEYIDKEYKENDIENDRDSKELQPLRSSNITQSEGVNTCLPEDTFSFLISSPVCSGAFRLAMYVFAFQIAIFSVLLYDITDFSFRYNRLQFPAKVEKSVMIAEALAGVVAVITQDDVRKAVNLLRESSCQWPWCTCTCCPRSCPCFNINQDIRRALPAATKSKWIWSILMRAIVGLFGLFLTFLLIMQSTTVIDLLLNFTAMEFVSLLDDVVFVLTREGFFGRKLQEEAKKILNASYPSRLPSESKCASCCGLAVYVRRALSEGCASCFAKLCSKTKICEYFRWALSEGFASCVANLHFVIWLGLFFYMFFWIGEKQKDGDYFCHNILAQFGDEVIPILGTLTGLFHLRKGIHCQNVYGGRVSYLRNSNDGEALLAYCKKEERWTISLPNGNLTTDDKKCEDNPCDESCNDPCNWIAASSVTKGFNVLTTANSEWIVRDVRDGPKRISSLSQHFLACHDCVYTTGFCGQDEQFGECDANTLEEGWKSTCECNTDQYGFQCEYQPCEMLEISRSRSGNSFEKQDGTSSFASKYYRLEGVEAYNRPVYTSASLDDDQMISNGTDIILFTGVRWILSSKDFFPGLKDNKNVSEYFSHFHGHFTDYNASYVSEPVYIGRLDDEASPSGLQWLHASYSGGVSDKEFDQRLQLQPDLQKGSIETEFCCGNCSNVE